MLEKYHKVYQKDYETWYQENKSYREMVKNDPMRLRFHLMPETGWLNDPNGLCQFHGTYHIYYQYTPFETTGKLKLWGHYETKDFINYKDMGPVLFPDSQWDAHGVYSGSAFIKHDTLYYVYTGNIKYFDQENYDYINSGRGSNTILTTSKDGQHFDEKQLLMTVNDYPGDMSNHVRDPKIFEENGTYYMVLGARDIESKGMVLLYESKDLKQWTYKNRITTKETFGYMWECPDVFTIDGQMFLTCCPQGVVTDGMDYANVHQSVAMSLSYDFMNNTYELGEMKQLDRGHDFYAQQTFEDEKKRRILIGWMGIPDATYTNPTTESGWQHALTIPREVFAHDGKIHQKPIEEMKQLRTKDYAICSFYYGQELIFQNLVYEAVVDFTSCEEMEFVLRDDVKLLYQHGVLTLDLGKSGAGREPRMVKLKQLNRLQVFADTSSVEIFVNEGEEVFTSRIYSLNGKISICGECRGTMEVYPLKSFSIVKGDADEE